MTDEVVSARFGDVIGVYRGPTKHYGIYVNNHSVIHYAPYVDEFDRYYYIRETTLDRFLHGRSNYFLCVFPEVDGDGQIDIRSGRFASLVPFCSRIKLLQLFDQIPGCRLLSPQQTAHRALSRVGEREYTSAIGNCENFVIWCKTGICETATVKALLGLLPNLDAHIFAT